jgi:hypothetical protein
MTKLFQPPKGAFCHPMPLFCSILTSAYEFCQDIEQALTILLKSGVYEWVAEQDTRRNLSAGAQTPDGDSHR